MMQRIDHLVLVGLGGVAGATLRWLVGETITVDSFPWHTLLVNVVGCALLAAVTTSSLPLGRNRLIAAGFCGGLTTFSTFSIEVIELLDSNENATALLYLVASIALGLIAYVGVRRKTLAPPNLDEAA